MWPATLIGSNIGRRCCGCWFEQLKEETVSLLTRVGIEQKMSIYYGL